MRLYMHKVNCQVLHEHQLFRYYYNFEFIQEKENHILDDFSEIGTLT